MNQKTIQTILFIFFLFLYNLVKSEEPKLKIVKVKEFNSYEEYERWKGKVKKPSRIIVDKGIVKFCDEKGKVIREKKYRYMTDEERKKIREEYEKTGKDIKDLEFYSENVKVLPDDRGILLIKVTYYYEGFVPSYEIYDKEGNLINKIDDYVNLLVSPDNRYFVGYYEDEGGMYGEIKFFDINGNLLNTSNVFDFDGFSYNIVFSSDSKYVAVSRDGGKKGGIAVFNDKGVLLWKKIELNYQVDKLIFSPSGDKIFAFVIHWGVNYRSYRCKIYAFKTENGEEIWDYELKGPALDTEIFDSKMVVFDVNDIVYILNIESGKLLKMFTSPVVNEYSGPFDKFLFLTKDLIFIRIRHEKLKEIIFVADWDGNILGKQEITAEGFLSLIPEKNGFVVVKENKVELYEFSK